MTSIVKRPQLWFKILHPSGKAIDGTREQWSIPQGKKSGEWLNFQELAALDPNGGHFNPEAYVQASWLTDNPKPIYTQFQGSKIYIAEYRYDPVQIEPGLIWVREARLIREATNLDLKPFGIHRAFQQVF